MAGDNKRKATAGEDRQIKVSKISKVPVFLSDVGHLNVPRDAKFSSQKTDTGMTLKGKSRRMRYTCASLDNNNTYCVAVIGADGSAELVPAESIELKAMSKEVAKREKEQAASDKSFRDQKNSLGHEFGTLKAKKMIADTARNYINAEHLQDFEEDVVDVVSTATINLPTTSEIDATMASSRPIPAHNSETLNVKEIYPLEGIVTQEELDYIRIQPLMDEADLDKRMDMFPYKQSQIVRDSVAKIKHEDQIGDLKVLYYLALLMGFYSERRLRKKQEMSEKLRNPPHALLEGVLQRYSISLSGNVGRHQYNTFSIDPLNEARLLCAIVVLILRLNHYVVDLPILSPELGLKPSKLAEICKQIGCSIKNAPVSHMEAIGRTKKEAANWKIAKLKAPLKLPELARKMRARG